MESIKYTPECVQKSEEDDQSALAHRDRVLEHFSTSPGLGPIDLVVCRKAGKDSFGPDQHGSFFHQVLGHDLTSTASAAAYFAELCNSTEEVCIMPSGCYFFTHKVVESLQLAASYLVLETCGRHTDASAWCIKYGLECRWGSSPVCSRRINGRSLSVFTAVSTPSPAWTYGATCQYQEE